MEFLRRCLAVLCSRQMLVYVALALAAAAIWFIGPLLAFNGLRPLAGIGMRVTAIVLLLASGYILIFGVFGGFAGAGLHVHLMQALGIVMMLLFLHLYFAPWRRFRAAVARRDTPQAARQLNQIRWIVTVNLALGLLTVAIGSSGRYWG